MGEGCVVGAGGVQAQVRSVEKPEGGQRSSRASSAGPATFRPVSQRTGLRGVGAKKQRDEQANMQQLKQRTKDS